ncbi:hypothetical protein CHS0354_003755 [Potamilus streckersoni]|uniref:Uncharacterized protein n=1 Tax=Potamilus streckersoni TaxID=2493646 RepID=A0AAE0RU28_9BIVA|nr:hypothetical protein CHS0354_003755 [Potamilus streckersoni]
MTSDSFSTVQSEHLSYFYHLAPTISEVVWLKDVTRNFKREEMTHDDLDLPDELIFQLTGRSGALTLNLKRNHGIDPNAGVYFVRNLKDSQPHLDKTLSLEQEVKFQWTAI